MTGKVVLTAPLLSGLLVAVGCAPSVPPPLDTAEYKEVLMTAVVHPYMRCFAIQPVSRPTSQQ
jgi:hypothetical protein